jgi:RNA polymerase sigma-70 factor (ECF subfamily)
MPNATGGGRGSGGAGADAGDVALVHAAQRGDRQAFGELVSRHARSILRLTSRMLGPAADAEDVAQEVFVAAFRALPGFQGEAAFSTWLYRIAVNRCRDVLRARRPAAVSLDDERDAGGWEPLDAETPERGMQQAETASAIECALDALPPLYRESFVLRHIEGLGYAEMSAVLGVGRDTLKMRVYKARTLLARALSHLHAAPR